MKLLLMLVVLLVAVGLWKSRRPPRTPTAPPRPPPKDPTPMVACQSCGLHLPASEALVTPHGTFCCAAHRDRPAAP